MILKSSCSEFNGNQLSCDAEAECVNDVVCVPNLANCEVCQVDSDCISNSCVDQLGSGNKVCAPEGECGTIDAANECGVVSTTTQCNPTDVVNGTIYECWFN